MDDSQARARALSSPLRLRILRLCLHQGRTNKELADALALNPATTLHHVRTLLATGFLAAQEPRIGRRGAREIPYLATRLSWNTEVPDLGPVLVETFLQEIQGLESDELEISRLGLKLNKDHQEQMRSRFRALLQEYAGMPADPDGEPTSIFFVHHPDRSAPTPR
ncbi:helix-turn-helix domain-containing protein [Arthrobacter sp. 35W]|uniref:helix-turn-helix domain-containing protein n=1 Tax=Arthrobacter sp. 35W TaxID=1132441 RepID=UPI000409253A|nr:helix-turn-helix domain-containing protein [Arthrobacter sp. 35W]